MAAVHLMQEPHKFLRQYRSLTTLEWWDWRDYMRYMNSRSRSSVIVFYCNTFSNPLYFISTLK